MKTSSAVESAAIVVISLLIAAGAIALLSGYFSGQDTPGVTGSSSGPGLAIRDMGDTHLRAGESPPAYDSNPPTSGPHVLVPVGRDEASLTNNQLLSALELGNVVFMYGSPSPPRGLKQLATTIAGPFTQALADTGQAVVLARRPRVSGVIGLAWAHLIHVITPSDPSLRQFAEYWLGRGAR